MSLTGAVAFGAARPYVVNQNIYLLHGVGARSATLRGDWLLSTNDSFPLFSQLVGLVHRIGGKEAIVLFSFLTVAVALLGVFLLASALVPEDNSALPIAALATLLVASAHPLAWQLWRNPDISTFGGFGGQYLFVGPTFLQPANAGALVILALGIRAHAGRRIPRRVGVIASVSLIALTSALHPGYLLAIVVGGTSAFVSAVTISRSRSLALESVVTVAAAGGAVAGSSPVWRSSVGAETDVFDYLAFVRIPHHTLVSNWSWMDVILILLIVISGFAAQRLLHSWAVAVTLISALSIGLAAAVYVEWSRHAIVGIAAPWRVSVFLVPVASTLVATAGSRAIVHVLRGREARWVTVAAVAVVGIAGGASISREAPDPSAAPGVRIVTEVDPRGVGLIPIHFDDVRLNAGYPVFVDWKSHPHAVEDLEEWIRRVERVRSATGDSAAFCRLMVDEGISWWLSGIDDSIPECVAGWARFSRGELRVLVNPDGPSAPSEPRRRLDAAEL